MIGFLSPVISLNLIGEDLEPYSALVGLYGQVEILSSNFIFGSLAFKSSGSEIKALNTFPKFMVKSTPAALMLRLPFPATTMGANKDGIMEKSVSIFGKDVNIKVNVGNAIKQIFPAPQDTKYSKELNDFLKDARIVMTVKACHYLPNKNDYGTKDKPTPVSEMGSKSGAQNNPIIFWGLNAFQNNN